MPISTLPVLLLPEMTPLLLGAEVTTFTGALVVLEVSHVHSPQSLWAGVGVGSGVLVTTGVATAACVGSGVLVTAGVLVITVWKVGLRFRSSPFSKARSGSV